MIAEGGLCFSNDHKLQFLSIVSSGLCMKDLHQSKAEHAEKGASIS